MQKLMGLQLTAMLFICCRF